MNELSDLIPPRQKRQKKKSVKPVKKAEQLSKDEMREVHNAFKDRAKNEQARFMRAVDSEYWCCICFQTREQKEAWLKATGLAAIGDKYLDGKRVAAKMRVILPSVPKSQPIKAVDKKLLALVKE